MAECELTYSIAIRTLGKNPEVLKQELESVMRQTIQPEKVIVYIADGYPKPMLEVGQEQYIWVKKGMVAQRALEYREIDSDVILLLDDDVELADNSAERMLRAMEDGDWDCVAADTFNNQDMTAKQKIMVFVTNMVYARKNDKWAFKQCRNGSFSFNGNPDGGLYQTETFAGPCWMVKKKALAEVALADELWMDGLGFAYGDDMVESYKFFLNGYRCAVLYDSGVKNLDAKTSSGIYHKSDRMFYTRSFGMFATWWRMIYQSRDKRWLSAWLYVNKSMWQLFVHLCLGLVKLNLKIPYNYVKGFSDGWKYVHSEEFRALPPYIIRK